MNNMGFFNPFGGSGSGGGGGGSTANYSVQAVTDSSGQVSYKLTKNGTAVGDVISFNGSNMLVSYGGELVVLNSAIAGIEEALNKTYNFTTFTELEIDTHNKTLTQITDELLTKNLPQNTIVTGQIYTDALPFSGNGEAEVLVNRPAFWWTCKSLTTAPYSWTALTVDQAWGGVIYDWTPSNYELPAASGSTLGGVKVGSGLSIDQDGVLSATGGGESKEYLAGEGISITERSEESDTPVDISSEHWVNESPTGGGSRYTMSTDRTYLLQRYSLAAGTRFRVKFVPTNPTDIIYYGFDSYPSNSDNSGGIVVIGQTGPVDGGFEVDQSKTYTMPADRNSLDIIIRINDTIWSSSDVVSAASFTELKLIITESISHGTFIDANVRDGLEIDPDDNTINVTPATNQTIGGVIIGDGISVDENGVISVSEITAQDVDDLWESLIPSTSEFVSNTQAVSDGYDDGDIGVATQDT